MGLKAEDAQIWTADRADSTSMSAESMSDAGDGVSFEIDDSTKDVFDPTVSFTVEVDSGSGFATVSASTYTIFYTIGVVVFDSDQTGNSVQITGSHLPKYTVAEAFETEVNVSPNLLEVTQFGDDAPRRITGLRNLTASFGSYNVSGLTDNIDSGGDDDGPSLSEMVLGTAAQPNTVFRFAQDSATHKTKVGAFVRFDEQSPESSSGDAQTVSYSMQISEVASAMSTQGPADIDLLSL